ncbi:MAG: pirin family protein [Gordonia sp. (in: high G+C Gram-positive bacteria)]|uniref:pirin family protein n=1 Tax=Gordonia sp. (in: high G+C Gram-positive bacteria) TaxID=84139 RepID=UPI0039E280D0
MSLHVVRGADRATTTTDWLTSRHGFSFGDHYDPTDTHHGVLLVHNDETVAPGQGFDTHPHRETEIVTWVLSGSLVHQDSRGHSGLIHPGLAQRMSAGTGILHSERNDHGPGSAAREPVHYVQMWLLPDETGADPSYEQCDVSTELAAGGLIPLASGDPAHDSAVRIRNAGATLWVARLAAGERTTIPSARFTHLFVTVGTVRVEGHTLEAADTLRAREVTGSEVVALVDTELLIWSMDKALGE